jgi:hypothetical protein
MITHETFSKEVDGLLAFVKRSEGFRHTLKLSGLPLYRDGFRCGTCGAMYENINVSPLPIAPEQLSNILAGGGREVISEQLIDTIKPLLPKGKYAVACFPIAPRLVAPRLVEQECYSQDNGELGVDYLWEGRVFHRESERRGKFPILHEQEVVLPNQSLKTLSQERIREYYNRYKQERNAPIALALSVVEYRYWQGRTDHIRLTHFLLDGHHKMAMAAQHGRVIKILSFLNITFSDEVGKENLTIRSYRNNRAIR